MLNLRYIEETTDYSVSFRNISENVVEVVGADLPARETGFIVTRIGDPSAFTGDYTEFKTVYREVEGGFQYSNDGSIYIKPLPKVFFNTSSGGMLEGETMQEAEKYEELRIPTPKASENYEFTGWKPEVPESGEIEGNKSFTAVFTSTLPEPEPDPTLEERIATLESDIQQINDALGGE